METRAIINYELTHDFVEKELRRLLYSSWLRLKDESIFSKVDLSKEYQSNGRKTTRILARLLEEACVLREDATVDFQKALSFVLGELGKLYQKASRIVMRVKIIPAYIAYRDGLVGCYGDDNSCLKIGGCNEGHGLFIAHGGKDWEGFFIACETSTPFYGKARCWLFLHEKVAWLCNVYMKGFLSNFSKQEILSFIAEGLKGCLGFERITGVNPFQYSERVPIYLNGDELFLLPSEEEEIPKKSPFVKAECPICGEYKKLETGENIEIPRSEVSKNIDPLCLWGDYIKNLPLCSDCITDYGEEYYYCIRCGAELSEDEAHWYDGEPYCENCFFRRYFYCSYCGEPESRDYEYYVHGFGQLCEICVDRFERRGAIYMCYWCDDLYAEVGYPSEIVWHPDDGDTATCPGCLERLLDDGEIRWNEEKERYEFLKE